MAYLYVANTTQQHQIVFYRTDVAPPGANVPFTAPKQQAIPPGRQVTVGGNLDKNELDFVIEQLNQYGMVGEVDIPNNLQLMVHPFIFNIDRPISPRSIQTVMEHNMGIKMNEGQRRREAAAIGANQSLALAAQTANVPDPRQFDVEYEQMELTSDEKRLEQGFHVVKDMAEVPATKVKRGPGRPRKNPV
jgi:hypothetical protein